MTVHCRVGEDRDAAKERYFAAHPEDRGANVVIFHFTMKEMTTRARIVPAGRANVN